MTEGNSNPADWWERKEGGWQSSSWGAGPTDQVEGPSLTVSHLPKVPWDDLRYLFGEIMYGGHITDDWDRRLCRTYLAEYLQTEMLEGGTLLAPGFQIPPSLDYKGYHEYIDENLPPESPYLYGLHPNAEIGFLTVTSEKLFRTVLEMQPKESDSGAGTGASREEKAGDFNVCIGA